MCKRSKPRTIMEHETYNKLWTLIEYEFGKCDFSIKLYDHLENEISRLYHKEAVKLHTISTE